MPRRKSRASGFNYIPLVFFAALLLLWVAGVLKIQVTPELSIPPQVQTPIAGLPDVIGTLPAAINTLGATPAPTAPGSRGAPAAALNRALFFKPTDIVYNRPNLTEENHMADRPIRILIAKPGLDGHDRGAKVVARALRDAGMEVIYTGIRQTPEMIAEAALQEDVDVVGLSILSGAHMDLFPRIVEILRQKGLDDVLLVCGGIIPEEDSAALKKMGFAGIFGPGASTQDLAKFIREQVAAHRSNITGPVTSGGVKS